MPLKLDCDNRFSVITIDQDDTLWDNTPTLVHAENKLYEWIKKELPEISNHYSIDDLKNHRRLIATQNPEISHNLTRQRFASLDLLCKKFDYLPDQAIRALDVFLEARNHVTLYEDVVPFLNAAIKDYRIVALSNGNADINVIGLGHYFTLSVSASDVARGKPEPDMFDRVKEELSVEADSIIHIGDEPETDILGAHRAGIYSIWINRNNNNYPDHIPTPDIEIDSLSQLL